MAVEDTITPLTHLIEAAITQEPVLAPITHDGKSALRCTKVHKLSKTPKMLKMRQLLNIGQLLQHFNEEQMQSIRWSGDLSDGFKPLRNAL
jgi:hypothetical protein